MIKVDFFQTVSTGFDQLKQWLLRHSVERIHACLEAIGSYSEPLALYLHSSGYTMSLVNPAATKAFAANCLSSTKTWVDTEL